MNIHTAESIKQYKQMNVLCVYCTKNKENILFGDVL
jgi:hypothetical protein